VNVETKRSISQLTKTRPPHSLLVATLRIGPGDSPSGSRPPGPENLSLAAGFAKRSRQRQLGKRPWRSLRSGPSTKPAPYHGILPGADGLIWDRMGLYGRQRFLKDISAPTRIYIMWFYRRAAPTSHRIARKPILFNLIRKRAAFTAS